MVTVTTILEGASPEGDETSRSDDGGAHRDVKPGNLFLGSNGEVKVLDFGLARLVEVEGPAPPTPSPSPRIRATATRPPASWPPPSTAPPSV